MGTISAHAASQSDEFLDSENIELIWLSAAEIPPPPAPLEVIGWDPEEVWRQRIRDAKPIAPPYSRARPLKS